MTTDIHAQIRRKLTMLLEQVILPLMLGIMFFGVGMSLRWQDFTRALIYKRAFVYGVSCQYFIFPAICFGFCALFKIPDDISLGIMLLAACPSASASNLFTFIYKGDTAFSVTMSSFSVLFTPFTIPLIMQWSILYFYGESRTIEIPFAETVIKTIIVSVVPIVLGMLFRKINLSMARRSKRAFEVLSSAFILLIILGLLAKYAKTLNNIGIALLASFPLSCIGISLGLIAKKFLNLPERMVRAISFEVCVQSGVTAVFVGVSILHMIQLSTGVGMFGLTLYFLAYVWGYYLEKTAPINRFQIAASPK